MNVFYRGVATRQQLSQATIDMLGVDQPNVEKPGLLWTWSTIPGYEETVPLPAYSPIADSLLIDTAHGLQETKVEVEGGLVKPAEVMVLGIYGGAHCGIDSQEMADLGYRWPAAKEGGPSLEALPLGGTGLFLCTMTEAAPDEYFHDRSPEPNQIRAALEAQGVELSLHLP